MPKIASKIPAGNEHCGLWDDYHGDRWVPLVGPVEGSDLLYLFNHRRAGLHVTSNC
jgi:hypothetical protein